MSDRTTRSVAVIAVVAAALSLALNGYMLWTLGHFRTTSRQAVDAAIIRLDEFSVGELRYTYHLSQTIPFEGNIPVKQELSFPFTGTVPIDTTFPLTVNTPLGPLDLNIPVKAQFPIDVKVPVKIDQTFPMKTTVPVEMDVPIVIRFDQPPFDAMLAGIRAWLLQMRDSF